MAFINNEYEQMKERLVTCLRTVRHLPRNTEVYARKNYTCCHAVKNLLSSALPSKNAKTEIRKTAALFVANFWREM